MRVELTIEAWHLIGRALGELPAKESMGLILEIDRQLQLQATEPGPAVEPNEDPPEAFVDIKEETFGAKK